MDNKQNRKHRNLYLGGTLLVLSVVLSYIARKLAFYYSLNRVESFFMLSIYTVFLPTSSFLLLFLKCIFRSKFPAVSSIIATSIGIFIAVLLPYISVWFDMTVIGNPLVDFYGLGFFLFTMPVNIIILTYIGWHWDIIWKKLLEKPPGTYDSRNIK